MMSPAKDTLRCIIDAIFNIKHTRNRIHISIIYSPCIRNVKTLLLKCLTDSPLQNSLKNKIKFKGDIPHVSEMCFLPVTAQDCADSIPLSWAVCWGLAPQR